MPSKNKIFVTFCYLYVHIFLKLRKYDKSASGFRMMIFTGFAEDGSFPFHLDS